MYLLLLWSLPGQGQRTRSMVKQRHCESFRHSDVSKVMRFYRRRPVFCSPWSSTLTKRCRPENVSFCMLNFRLVNNTAAQYNRAIFLFKYNTLYFYIAIYLSIYLFIYFIFQINIYLFTYLTCSLFTSYYVDMVTTFCMIFIVCIYLYVAPIL